jgi:DNA processing protein
MENIIAHGAVLTPYPYGKEALPFRFIQRNGILASWCDPLIVVEARLKSGSVLTARKALSKGERVLAVPNSLLEPRSGGTNQLLAEGAAAYLNDELLDNHNGPIMQGNQNQVVKIITALEAHPLGTGELVASVGDESSLVMESLAAMELAEQIEYRSDGKWHRVGGP